MLLLFCNLCLYFIFIYLFWDDIVGRVLVVVVISGSLCFFLGIDSVFYERYIKEVFCGCVGIFSVFIVFFLYVEVFD